MKRILLAAAAMPLTACIWGPADRTIQESTAPIFLSGYAASAGESITLSALNHTTGNVDTLGPPVIADSSPSFSSPYPFYAWSTTITPAADYWAPQSVTISGVTNNYIGLATGPGRIEITATSGGSQFYTFSAAAQTCVMNAVNSGATVFAAGEACEDGQSLVIFDDDGVGSSAPPSTWSTGWTHVTGGTDTATGIPWEIGRYTVQSGSSSQTIYALVCTPTTGGTHKAMIWNHGLSSLGVTDDDLQQHCVHFAGEGYVTAVPAFRGQPITLTGVPPYTSSGEVELCLGEVLDSIQMATLVGSRTDVDPTRMVMAGHSHGACITERAVESGVKVKAAAAFSAPTDMVAWYDYCAPGSVCATMAAPANEQAGLAYGLGQIVGHAYGTSYVTPSPNPVPYTWRSPLTFAADLTARKDVPMIFLQGGSDWLIEPSQACALLSASAGSSSQNWHFASSGSVVASPPLGIDSAYPTGCGGYTSLTWQSSAPTSSSWTAGRNLLVYDGVDHGGIIVQTGHAWLAFESWLATVNP